MPKKKYVLLRGIEEGNRFFTTNDPSRDMTKLADGKVAYTILGYAGTIAEAQVFLYSKSFTTSNE